MESPTLNAIALDCETTGVDVYHGAKPYLVTMYDDSGKNTFWEWDVDPLTREPIIPSEDIAEIQGILDDEDCLIFQNAKFDAGALATIGIHFDWHKVHDTLYAAHLLASNRPHDLTSLALEYLRVRIQPFEDAIKVATNEARRIAKSDYPKWRIAREGQPDMPSAKSETKSTKGAEGTSPWKFDMWLPRQIAAEKGYPANHPWWTVCSEYANPDPAVTYAIFYRMWELLELRDLTEIYIESLKLLPIASGMEHNGVTAIADNMDEIEHTFKEEAIKAGNICRIIAESYDYEIKLPKGSSPNKSLTTFIFDVLKLPVAKVSKKTGKPSLDKTAMTFYESTLPMNEKPYRFLYNLKKKRKRDTALSFIKGYRRFWLPVDDAPGYFRLHPFVNPVGTDTRRWACKNPNSQNISKQDIDGANARYAFGPAPGREWWSCDAKNIELRIPAYLSGEEEMIALFERPNDPPYYGSNHILIFSILWPELWEDAIRQVASGKTKYKSAAEFCKEEYDDTYYQWTKNGNFAVQYGAIEKEGGTADRAYHQVGAQAKIKARFQKIDKLNQETIHFAEEYGYVETLPDKTVNPNRGYPLLCTRTLQGRILPTVPLNYRVQGTAMQWTNKGMVRTQAKLDHWRSNTGFDGFITIQSHDELVFDFPKSKVHPSETDESNLFSKLRSNLWRIRILQSEMAKGGEDIGIPTPVSCKYHEHNWKQSVAF